MRAPAMCMFCRSLFVLLYFFFLCHCVVCSSSICWFWLPLWYLQTLLKSYIKSRNIKRPHWYYFGTRLVQIIHARHKFDIEKVIRSGEIWDVIWCRWEIRGWIFCYSDYFVLLLRRLQFLVWCEFIRSVCNMYIGRWVPITEFTFIS
jgi:hypothetical protein